LAETLILNVDEIDYKIYKRYFYRRKLFGETSCRNTFYGIGREILLETKEMNPLIRKNWIQQNFTTCKNVNLDLFVYTSLLVEKFWKVLDIF
jgi:hypothetical protein